MQPHEFHRPGDVEGHLNEQHHYLPDRVTGTAELLAVHRELHLIEQWDRRAYEEDLRPLHRGKQ